MDENKYKMIDRYLRNEMSPGERLNFEQDALNDPVLREEIEITYRIKRRLSDRQQKLYKTKHWENKRKFKIASLAAVASFAAVIVVGFFMVKPLNNATDSDSNIVALAKMEESEKLKNLGEKAILSVKKSMSEGKEEIAIAEVDKLEKQNLIPALKNVSGGKFVTSQSVGTEVADALRNDAYELYWLKIHSLISIGKYKEAEELLKSFVKIDGQYKDNADSLLQLIILRHNE